MARNTASAESLRRHRSEIVFFSFDGYYASVAFTKCQMYGKINKIIALLLASCVLLIDRSIVSVVSSFYSVQLFFCSHSLTILLCFLFFISCRPQNSATRPNYAVPSQVDFYTGSTWTQTASNWWIHVCAEQFCRRRHHLLGLPNVIQTSAVLFTRRYYSTGRRNVPHNDHQSETQPSATCQFVQGVSDKYQQNAPFLSRTQTNIYHRRWCLKFENGQLILVSYLILDRQFLKASNISYHVFFSFNYWI